MVPTAMVTPTRREVLASAKNLQIMVPVPAPILTAASITPGSTSLERKTLPYVQ